MIPAKRFAAQPARWQELWRDAITDPRELLQQLDLEDHADACLAGGETGFALRVPRGFVARMRRGDPTDPLLLQVLPQAAEMFHREAAVLEKHLAQHDYLVDGELTLADFTVVAPLFLSGPAKMPLEKYDNIRTWFGKQAAMPAWQETAPRR